MTRCARKANHSLRLVDGLSEGAALAPEQLQFRLREGATLPASLSGRMLPGDLLRFGPGGTGSVELQRHDAISERELDPLVRRGAIRFLPNESAALAGAKYPGLRAFSVQLECRDLALERGDRLLLIGNDIDTRVLLRALNVTPFEVALLFRADALDEFPLDTPALRLL